MKLAAQQLVQHLTKTLHPIYVVSGDEPLLTQEALELIRNAAYAAGFTERRRVDVESVNDWGNLFYSNTQSLSLFSNKQLIELDLTHAKLNASNSKVLQEYAEQSSSDILLLVRTAKLDSRMEQAKWVKALDKNGIIISVWPIPIEQLPAWIMQRAKKVNLNMTKPAADLLAVLVEGNLLAAAQELEKLFLLQGSNLIDPSVIEKNCIDLAQFDIFTLVDSTLTGNSERSVRILNNLLAEGTEPTLILWALTREFRNMAKIAEHVQQGEALSSIFQRFRIWEKRQPSVRAFLKRYKQQDCWGLLVKAAYVDRLIKGAEVGNVQDELRGLVV